VNGKNFYEQNLNKNNCGRKVQEVKTQDNYLPLHLRPPTACSLKLSGGARLAAGDAGELVTTSREGRGEALKVRFRHAARQYSRTPAERFILPGVQRPALSVQR